MGGHPTVEVVVGRIAKAHGLRGEVAVDVRTDEPDLRFAVEQRLRAVPRPGSHFAHATLRVAAVRRQSHGLVVRFAELGDREAAEGARGVMLYADVDPRRRPSDPDEFYDHQLVGLTAYDVGGGPLGEVVAVVHGGAQDLLTVRTPQGREALVPFVKALVPEVDLEGGRVVVADRPGLVTPLDDQPGG